MLGRRARVEIPNPVPDVDLRLRRDDLFLGVHLHPSRSDVWWRFLEDRREDWAPVHLVIEGPDGDEDEDDADHGNDDDARK